MKTTSRSIRRLGGLVSAGALLAGAGSAFADEPLVKLLDVLRARGSITEAEYQDLKKSADAPPAEEFKSLEQRLLEGADKVGRLEDELTSQKATMEKLSDNYEAAADKAIDAKLDGKWYQKLKLSGYAQVRYTSILDNDGAVLNVPNDGSARRQESFRLRRGRVKFSGDVTDRLYFYAQMDFAGSVVSGSNFAIQMRDLYGDVAIDAEKEFRLRVGQSKVPFGFVNLQSSQNRPTLERADALNSAAENERDIGAFLYWAPTEIRQRFKELTKLGLKGSGDYGLLGFGVYNGQGPNVNDTSGGFHTVARAAYPFKFDNGQFLELGVQGYHGQYRVSTTAIGAPAVAPSAAPDGTIDQRVGVSLIYYPQPWGFEAEWNIGRGPKLTPDFTTVNSSFLHGGYLMTYYQLMNNSVGRLFPFVRWNYYDGGRKFANNAPEDIVNELDFGFEWSPWKEIELVIQYTKTLERSNTGVFPYLTTSNADRVGFQLQLNY